MDLLIAFLRAIIKSTQNEMREEALRLVERYCIGEPRYINKINIVDDVHDELVNLISEVEDFSWEDDYRCDFIQEYATRIQGMLFVIKGEYLSDGDRGLDPRVNDLDLDIMGAVSEIAFLREKYLAVPLN